MSFRFVCHLLNIIQPKIKNPPICITYLILFHLSLILLLKSGISKPNSLLFIITSLSVTFEDVLVEEDEKGRDDDDASLSVYLRNIFLPYSEPDFNDVVRVL